MNHKIAGTFQDRWTRALVAGSLAGLAIGLTTSNVLAANFDVKNNGTSGCSLWRAIAGVNNPAATQTGCPRANGTPSNPDVIRLAQGVTFTLPTTITINNSVTISSWNFSSGSASRNRAMLLQGGPSSGGEGGMVMIDSPGSPSIKVTFNDIVIRGTGLTNTAHGFVTLGNDVGDLLTFNRCWVERFGGTGILVQNFGLNLIDTAVDSNGISLPGEFASGVFIESTFSSTSNGSTRLFMDKSSVTNNYEGGIQTELRANSTSTIMNSTIANNSGGSGLVITNGAPGSKVNIFGTTIANNNAFYFNGDPGNESSFGLYNDSGIVTIDQTVIDANHGPTFGSLDYFGPLQSMKNSIIGDDRSITNTPVRLGRNSSPGGGGAELDWQLTDNGGVSGQSRHPQSLKPFPGSICINFTTSIDSSVGGVSVGNLDEGHRTRGFPSSGFRFDVGAVELQSGE